MKFRPLGDRVVVRIERVKSDGRVEGRVIRILERSNTWLVGRYDRDEQGMGFGWRMKSNGFNVLAKRKLEDGYLRTDVLGRQLQFSLRGAQPVPAAVRGSHIAYADALPDVDLRYVVQIDAAAAQGAWSAEQCLRSGACGAVLSWHGDADTAIAIRTTSAAGCAPRSRMSCESVPPFMYSET